MEKKIGLQIQIWQLRHDLRLLDNGVIDLIIVKFYGCSRILLQLVRRHALMAPSITTIVFALHYFLLLINLISIFLIIILYLGMTNLFSGIGW